MPSKQEQFESLFKRHHKVLCDLAYNIVGDKDAAKDVVQEVFFKLWKNRDEIHFGELLRNYLFRATSHTAYNYVRSRRKIVRIDDASSLEERIANTPDSENAGYSELELRIRSAIDRLPSRCRTIYVMSRHEGLKYQEIASALNLSLKTVENQMGIALQKLREELKSYVMRGLAIGLVALLSALLQ
jgi:RNA polymerase sigma-70 factor (ECF subfamily)